MHNADDGYINTPLSVALHILVDLKQVFHDDACLDLNMFKTQILVKDVTVEAAWTSCRMRLERGLSPHLWHRPSPNCDRFRP